MSKRSLWFEMDNVLIASAMALILIGLIMVASSSIAIADRTTGQPLYYFIRQSIFLSLGLILAFFVVRLRIQFWFYASPYLLGLSLLLLAAVLIPGIGTEVNGARRWLKAGPIALQISEFVKLSMVIYTASYCVRHLEELKKTFWGFVKIMLVLAVVAALLLLEPDFGAIVVISATVLGMLFMAGVKWRHFALITALAIGLLATLAITSPYRWERLTTFMNPWADQFDTGYQLTQALIAFGRGGWYGYGLGSGIQKLFYLPEAHTDFMFAVIAEELGLIGLLVIVLIFAIFSIRGLRIARMAHKAGAFFHAFLAYGISFWLIIQTLISMGVNTGVLPTKGLTLPLLSYGGSSLLITVMAVAILIRISIECNECERKY